MKRDALIVGAGIGGLAAGRALRDAGYDVRVVERASALEPLGAGISLWPNAVRALRALGLEEITATGREPDADAGIRRWDGRLLARTDPAAIKARFGAPLVLLHRETLQRLLLADGIADLVETGIEVVGTTEENGRVGARTRTGESLEADLLLGADGIHSTVRAELLADGPPRHSGLLAYRGIAPSPSGMVRWGEYWGAGGVFGIVPIDGERLYWFATERTNPDGRRRVDPMPALLQRFEDWAPEVSEVIAATAPEAVLIHDLYDRTPSRRWTGGAIGLLGDAAHPMLPFLGQGACQALEDAVDLGRVLRSGVDVPDALRTYEGRRRRRVARVMRQSRRFGRLSHLRSAPARAVRDRAIALIPEATRLRQLDPIVGRD